MGVRAVFDNLTATQDGHWTVSSAERPRIFRLGQTAGLIFMAIMAVLLPLGEIGFMIACTILTVAVISGMIEKRVPDRNLDGSIMWLNTIGALICAALLPLLVPLAAISIAGTAAGFAFFQGRRMYLVLAISAVWLGAVGFFAATPSWYLVPVTMMGISTGLVEFADWFRGRATLQRLRMEMVTEVGGAFTWEYDIEARTMLQVNGPTESVLGRTGSELVAFLNEQAKLDPSQDLGTQSQTVRQIAHADGSLRSFKLERRIRNRADGVRIANGVAVDVTEIEQARLREQRRAEIDTLTGLANRNGLAQFLDTEADRVGRAMLVIDLDRFKDINDTLGHLAGDRLIAAAAQRLTCLSDDRCFIARLGGDEFAFAVVGDDADEVNAGAERLAGKVYRTLAESFAVDDVELTTSASVGIASGGALDWSELLRRADGAMYEAKRSGNGYRWYDHKIDEDSGLRLERRSRLNRTLEDEIVLYYQPVVSADGHRLVSVEALARWHHPDEGVLAPDVFLPLLENNALTARFDHHVLKTAVGCATSLASASPAEVKVSVNLTPRSLWSPQLLGELKVLFQENPLARGRLSIEVTEEGLFEEPERLAPILGSFKELGLDLSLDDFGTGASSLIRLRSLPFDTIKIDRSFVNGVPNDYTDTVIVQSTIELARNLGKKTVAEGVETMDQANALSAMGCDALQGWAFSKAVPLDELLEKHFSPDPSSA